MLSDASWAPRPPLLHGYGYVAFYAFFPDGSAMYAAGPVPHDILAKLAAIKPRGTYITSLEVMALCGAYFSIPYNLILGSDFHHFGDNSGANFSSMKNYSASPDIALMISAYNLQLARASARSWIDYVPTDLNLADLPTRPDKPEWPLLRDRAGAPEIDFVFPSLSDWATW